MPTSFVPAHVRTGRPVAVFVIVTITSNVWAVFRYYAIAVPRGATSPVHHFSPGTSVWFSRSAFH